MSIEAAAASRAAAMHRRVRPSTVFRAMWRGLTAEQSQAGATAYPRALQADYSLVMDELNRSLIELRDAMMRASLALSDLAFALEAPDVVSPDDAAFDADAVGRERAAQLAADHLNRLGR